MEYTPGSEVGLQLSRDVSPFSHAHRTVTCFLMQAALPCQPVYFV